MPDSAAATVVLVHGAFADASGFGGVIRELISAGHDALKTSPVFRDFLGSLGGTPPRRSPVAMPMPVQVPHQADAAAQ